MRWVTTERPKVDRIACPWLITRFIDREEEFLFVPSADVSRFATEKGATPFDVEGVKLSHDGPLCVVYEAIYAWLRDARHETHTSNPQQRASTRVAP